MQQDEYPKYSENRMNEIIKEECRKATEKCRDDMNDIRNRGYLQGREDERKDIAKEILDFLDKAKELWEVYVTDKSRKLSKGALELRESMLKNPYNFEKHLSVHWEELQKFVKDKKVG